MIRLGLLISTLLSAFVSKAQYSFTDNATGIINVSTIQSVTFSGGTAIPAFNSLSSYANGVTMPAYLTLSVKSNVSWLISVKAQNANFTPMTQGGSTNMPASVLSLKSAVNSSFIPMSTNSVTLKTGNRGGASTPGNNFALDVDELNMGSVNRNDFENARRDFYEAFDLSWKSLMEQKNIETNLLKSVSQTSRKLAHVSREVSDTLFPYCGLEA
ncbi:MAG: hypothetical protein EOP49_12080, partial [Sphingobacteriales bacterium]